MYMRKDKETIYMSQASNGPNCSNLRTATGCHREMLAQLQYLCLASTSLNIHGMTYYNASTSSRRVLWLPFQELLLSSYQLKVSIKPTGLEDQNNSYSERQGNIALTLGWVGVAYLTTQAIDKRNWLLLLNFP